jgi:HprK-related kinase B
VGSSRVRGPRLALALQLLAQGPQLVAADRFMLQVAADRADIHGVPDGARVNPGRLASWPALARWLPNGRRVQIDQLTTSDLWALEDKYWLDLEVVYGRSVLQPSARLCGILVLAWQPTQLASCAVTRKTWSERPGLASWLAKRPGPLCRASMAVNRSAAITYLASFDRQLESLAELPIWELTGRVDFPRATELCLELLT